MAEESPSLSVITLSVNALNSLIKRQRLAEWTKNTVPLYAAYKLLILHPNTQIG